MSGWWANIKINTWVDWSPKQRQVQLEETTEGHGELVTVNLEAPATPVRYSKQRLLCAYGTEAGACQPNWILSCWRAWGITLVDFESLNGI